MATATQHVAIIPGVAQVPSPFALASAGWFRLISPLSSLLAIVRPPLRRSVRAGHARRVRWRPSTGLQGGRVLHARGAPQPRAAERRPDLPPLPVTAPQQAQCDGGFTI